MSSPRLRRSACRASVLFAGLLVACATVVETGGKVVGGLTEGIPGRGATVRVQEVRERFGYLDALLATSGGSERLLFAPDAACRQVVTTGALLRLTREGSFGRVETADAGCPAVGSFALARLRDLGGRGSANGRPGSPGRPRALAIYRVTGGDESFYVLRGRFPLAGLVGVTGSIDLVALLPHDAVCEPLTRRESASLEYRGHGPPLVLVGPAAPCPIAALALPLTGGG